MNVNKQKKLQNQRQLCTQLTSTENGTEVKVIARESFFENNENAERISNIQPNIEDGIVKGIKLKPDDIMITFDKKKIQKIYKDKKISIDTYNELIEMLDIHEQAKNTDISHKTPYHENPAKLINQMGAIRTLLSLEDLAEQQRFEFKRYPYIDRSISFQVNQPLLDRLNYLPELLDEAKLYRPKLGEDTYKVISEITIKDVGTIGLYHELKLSRKHPTPEGAFAAFIEDIKGEALKVFLAHWAYASDYGSIPLLAYLIDIMSTTKETGRKSSFSCKEKRRFWELSRLLEETYLTIRFKIKDEEFTVKHSLLTIQAVSCKTTKRLKDHDIKNLIFERGYPDRVQYTILDPDRFKEKANLATEISKGTVKLPQQDIMLAIALQVRAGQRRNKPHSEYDRPYLIEKGGLKLTYQANKGQGERRLKEKLDRIQKAQAIGSYEDSGNDKIIIKKREKKQTK